MCVCLTSGRILLGHQLSILRIQDVLNYSRRSRWPHRHVLGNRLLLQRRLFIFSIATKVNCFIFDVEINESYPLAFRRSRKDALL